jgi:hypothetical protein
MEMVFSVLFIGALGLLSLPVFKWLEDRQTKLKTA